MNASAGTARQTPAYPLGLRMGGRLAVVVGAGPVAVRRVAGLRAAGAGVLVVAPGISAPLGDLAARGLIMTRQGSYTASDLDGAWLVLACTDQPAVNAAVAADAERLRLWCVGADDVTESEAWVPGARRAGAITLALNADRDPRHAAAIRGWCLPVAGETAATSPRSGDGPGIQAGGEGEEGERRGRVGIVVGRPGDPGLITTAGLDRLRHADVAVADRLVAPQLVADLPDGVRVANDAKVPGGPATPREDINAALAEHHRAGRAVERPKGGDPHVFGRGREEADACLAAGIPVDVIPGVTSDVSFPAADRLPVTRQEAFTVVPGHLSPAGHLSLVYPRSTVDLAAPARAGTTLGLPMTVDYPAEIEDAPSAAVLAAETAPSGDPPLADLASKMRADHSPDPAAPAIGDTAAYAAAGRDDDQCGSLAAGIAAARAGRRTRPEYRGRVLVLGGARSGKSTTAERFLASCGDVEYVATGTLPDQDDREWAARVAEHLRRRPPHWRTSETLDLEQVLKSDDPAPVLIDCLSLWLARVMDECDAWAGGADADREAAARVDRLLHSWRATARHVVAVSNEVGCGVVPATASGRRYRDALGRLNAAIAADSDEVWFCTAGLPWRLR